MLLHTMGEDVFNLTCTQFKTDSRHLGALCYYLRKLYTFYGFENA